MMSSFAMSCRGGLGRLGETGTSALLDCDAGLIILEPGFRLRGEDRIDPAGLGVVGRVFSSSFRCRSSISSHTISSSEEGKDI
jgi:hypothetical protein